MSFEGYKKFTDSTHATDHSHSKSTFSSISSSKEQESKKHHVYALAILLFGIIIPQVHWLNCLFVKSPNAKARTVSIVSIVVVVLYWIAGLIVAIPVVGVIIYFFICIFNGVKGR